MPDDPPSRSRSRHHGGADRRLHQRLETIGHPLVRELGRGTLSSSARCTYLQAPQLSLFNNGTIAMIIACQALRLSGESSLPRSFLPRRMCLWNIAGVRRHRPGEHEPRSAHIEPLITNRTGAISRYTCGAMRHHRASEVADRHGLKSVRRRAFGMGSMAGLLRASATRWCSRSTRPIDHTAQRWALVVQDRTSGAHRSLKNRHQE
jgi:hypothetical protein